MSMLKKRLAQLRRESGSTASAAVGPADDSRPAAGSPHERASPAERPPLAERLRRHGHRPARPSAKRPGDRALAAQLGAEVISSGLMCAENRFEFDDRHGRIELDGLSQGPVHFPAPEGFDPCRAVFFDTETTGLSGGVGTLAFMIGAARVEGSVLVVRQWLLTGLGAEALMLEQAASWCEQASAGVSYNGLSFDLPLLAGRCRLTGVDDRFSAAPQLDLLHPVRRAFSSAWTECRLATVERRLLGFERLDDLPGVEAPAAWLAFLQRGDSGRLAAVLRHNLWDLLSLAALVPALDAVYRDPMRFGADLGAVARGQLKHFGPERALALLERHADELAPRERHDLARLYRNQGDWGQARALWEALAGQDDSDAIEALAKYHEHRRGDLVTALDYARRLPASEPRERRCERLLRRLRGRSPEAGDAPLFEQQPAD